MTSTLLTPESVQFLQKARSRRARLRDRWAYYHQDNAEFFQSLIQADSRVLVIGCDVGHQAVKLKAAEVHWFDLDQEAASQPLPAGLERVTDLPSALASIPFDYVILPYTLQYLENIQGFLETLVSGLRPQARIIALQYNFLWAPALKTAERLGLKSPAPDLNWLSPQDIRNLFDLTRFQQITSGGRCLIPFRIPCVTRWINRYLAPLPFLRWACQKTFSVARKLPPPVRRSDLSVSIVVPARNESGNIRALLDRLPRLGSRCELIFVEGHSRDDTWAEIGRQLGAHPRRAEFEIRRFQQAGEGKADAVRLGFSNATGDILMILDADLSVRPEDLTLFYNALLSGTADFVNGSRLVYKMESEAMQVMNLFFNKQFGILVSWLIGQPLKDTLCGTKALFRKDYERIGAAYPHLAKRDPFGDFELLFGAGRLCLKICDVPVWYKQRTYGRTNIRRFRHGWQLLRMCIASWPEFKS